MRRYMAEAVGTFAVALASVAVATSGSGASVAAAAGATVAAMTLAFAPISGGYFNPALAVGMATAGRLPLRELPAYVGAELAGGALGALAGLSLSRVRAGGMIEAARAAAPSLSRPGHHGVDAVLVAELALSLVLTVVVIGLADPRDRGGVAADVALGARPAATAQAVGMGLATAALQLVAWGVTGLGANPARALAPVLLSGEAVLGGLLAFGLAPLAGALAAGLMHRSFFAPPRSSRGRRTEVLVASARGTARPPRAHTLELERDDDDDAPRTLRSPRPAELAALRAPVPLASPLVEATTQRTLTPGE